MDTFLERVQRFPVAVTAPAAGNDWTVQIGASNLSNPGLGAWRLLSVAFQLATSAAGASRTVQLVMDDTTVTYYRVGAPGSQAVSLTEVYAAFEGSTGGGANGPVNHLAWASPAPVLYPGYRLRSITTNIDVGDQYSAIALMVEELPTGRYGQFQPSERTEFEPWYNQPPGGQQ